METIYYIILAFLVFSFIKSIFFTDRTPIPETSGKVYKPSSATELRSILNSHERTIVDFYADWCPPCRAIAPIFSSLADAHAIPGRLAFAKINVDHAKDENLAGQFAVTAMPTFVFFRRDAPAGVSGTGLSARASVVMVGEKDGLVERVRGADKAALEAVVRAMVAEVGGRDGTADGGVEVKA